MLPLHSCRAALILALGLAGAMSMAQAARAADDEIQVSASDLDLRSFTGQAELRHRIARAARKLCGPAESRGSDFYDFYADCVKQTQAKAEPQVRSLIAAARGNSLYVAALLVNR